MLGLTPGLKDHLRKRLKEHGYTGMERGSRKVLEADPVGVRARHGTWSEHALEVSGKVSADSASLGGAGDDGGEAFY